MDIKDFLFGVLIIGRVKSKNEDIGVDES